MTSHPNPKETAMTATTAFDTTGLDKYETHRAGIAFLNSIWEDHGMARPSLYHVDAPMRGGNGALRVEIKRPAGASCVARRHVFVNGKDVGEDPGHDITHDYWADMAAGERAVLAMVLAEA